MPRAPIRPLAPTATAEKRPTLPDRAPRTTTNIATPHTMLKGQGLRSAVTPMAAPRRIQPARETSATSAYGGSAYHAEGSGTTTATGAYGGTATHYQGVGTVGTTSSVRLHTPVTITTVGQLRFTIRRSLLTPTLRAATTAEAGPPPGQQLLAPLLALRLERQSRRPIIAQPTPMPTRPAWRRERQRRRRIRRCYCQRLQRWRGGRRGVFDGRNRRDDTSRLRNAHRRRHDVLLVRQHLVSAILRRKRRLLSRCASSVRLTQLPVSAGSRSGLA
jgi:hypothetical protein